VSAGEKLARARETAGDPLPRSIISGRPRGVKPVMSPRKQAMGRPMSR